MSDEEMKTELARLVKDGSDIIVEAYVEGECIFYSRVPLVESKPVIEAGVRTFAYQAYPEVVEEMRDELDESNGGAFQ